MFYVRARRNESNSLGCFFAPHVWLGLMVSVLEAWVMWDQWELSVRRPTVTALSESVCANVCVCVNGTPSFIRWTGVSVCWKSCPRGLLFTRIWPQRVWVLQPHPDFSGRSLTFCPCCNTAQRADKWERVCMSCCLDAVLCIHGESPSPLTEIVLLSASLLCLPTNPLRKVTETHERPGREVLLRHELSDTPTRLFVAAGNSEEGVCSSHTECFPPICSGSTDQISCFFMLATQQNTT